MSVIDPYAPSPEFLRSVAAATGVPAEALAERIAAAKDREWTDRAHTRPGYATYADSPAGDPTSRHRPPRQVAAQPSTGHSPGTEPCDPEKCDWCRTQAAMADATRPDPDAVEVTFDGALTPAEVEFKARWHADQGRSPAWLAPEPEPVDPAAVMAQIADAAGHLTTRIHRVEAHYTTIDALIRTTNPRPPWLPRGGPIGDELGVPIVVDDSLPVGGWRTLDRDGRVLRESHPAPPAGRWRRWWRRGRGRSG